MLKAIGTQAGLGLGAPDTFDHEESIKKDHPGLVKTLDDQSIN